MAKSKSSLVSLTQHAKEAAAQQPLIPDETPKRRRRIDPSDPYAALSTAMRTSEAAELTAWAKEKGATRGSLLTVLMRYAMREVRTGRVKLSAEDLKFRDIE